MVRVASDRVEAVIVAAAIRAIATQQRNAASEQAAQEAAEVEEADTTPKPDVEACRESFIEWLRWWPFRDRETGVIRTFANLWPGQQEAAQLMTTEAWLFLLKAGKLGFTELECAYDGWIVRFRPNSRVHIYSKEADSAKLILGFVKFGLQNIHSALRLPMYEGAGGDTTRTVMLRGGDMDLRTVASYASKSGKGTPGIDQSATHVHLDELSHCEDPETLYSDVSTIVPPDGTLHIVTRGRGVGVYTSDLWELCKNNGGHSRMFGYFADWRQRAGRDDEWYASESLNRPHMGMMFFAPNAAEDALAGDADNVYIPIDLWDAREEAMPALSHEEPCVFAIDAGVTGDLFAVVAGSANPNRPGDPAIRAVRWWKPSKATGRIDYIEVETWLRFMAAGGCPQGHPKGDPKWQPDDCPDCQRGNFPVPQHNILQFTYDPYQMEDMMQRFRDEGIAWCSEFSQMGERLVGDANMAIMARQNRLAHNGDPILREHIRNSKAQIKAGEDTRMRIVKRNEKVKIDCAVAASMCVKRVGDIILGQGGLAIIEAR